MTHLDLAAIEARAHAATPGPWSVDGDEIVSANGANVLRAWAEFAHDSGVEATAEDLAFIAHARADIPALIARVRELESGILAVIAEHDEIDRAAPGLPDYPAERPVLEDLASLFALDAKETP